MSHYNNKPMYHMVSSRSINEPLVCTCYANVPSFQGGAYLPHSISHHPTKPVKVPSIVHSVDTSLPSLPTPPGKESPISQKYSIFSPFSSSDSAVRVGWLVDMTVKAPRHFLKVILCEYACCARHVKLGRFLHLRVQIKYEISLSYTIFAR